jgi:hypothetical protein
MVITAGADAPPVTPEAAPEVALLDDDSPVLVPPLDVPVDDPPEPPELTAWGGRGTRDVSGPRGMPGDGDAFVELVNDRLQVVADLADRYRLDADGA